MPTTFQIVHTASKDQNTSGLTEPVIASFPQSVPQPSALKAMTFNLFEQQKSSEKSTKKRVLKSQNKTVKYEAKSFQTDSRPKMQGSDYYVGVYDQSKNKCYMVPVSATYQLSQKIDGFAEGFGATVENEDAIKNMTYYDKKQLLAQSFGTAKAQRKLASVLTNRVEDEPLIEGATKRANKGTRDTRLQDLAQDVKSGHDDIKKQVATAGKRRKTMYSKDALMPSDIFENLPYKKTFKALKEADEEELRNLLCPFVQQLARNFWNYSWDALGDDKTEKKRFLKGIVYLDVLITLYRMPLSFEFSMQDLSERFRDVQEEPLERILNKFCKIAVNEKNGPGAARRKKDASGSSAHLQGTSFKFMKSKEDTKLLMLHIIGLTVYLSSNGSARLSFLARILKKEPAELKNYCVELGLSQEVFKPAKKDDEDNKHHVESDIKVSFKPDYKERNAAAQKEKKQTAAATAPETPAE